MRVNREKRAIFITGIPGSGKSTLAGILARELGRTLITMHELVLRVDPESIGRGDMADARAMRKAFIQAMDEYTDEPIVVDGWPRTPDQADLLPADAQVFLLACRPDIATDRLTRRGRGDDTPELVRKRVDEQSRLLEVDERGGWAMKLAGWEGAVNTSLKHPICVAGGVLAYLRGIKGQAFDWTEDRLP